MSRMGLTVAAAAGACAAAWGARLTSQSYVQDGLVAQFDAIENVGVGRHENAPAVWKDLKGGASIAVPSGAGWIDRAYDSKRITHTIKGMPEFYLDSVSTEVAMNRIENGPANNYPRIIHHPASDGTYSVYLSGTGSTPQFFIEDRGSPRPTFNAFNAGTIGMVSDPAGYRTYNNGLYTGQSSGGTIATHKLAAAGDWAMNRQSGYLAGYYRALRHYDRPLTPYEFERNAVIDQLRFFSFTVTGTAGEAARPWATAGWTPPHGRTEACPNTLTNDYAQVIAATVSVAAADGVALRGLSLEDGAKLALGAGVDVPVKILWVEGEPVARGLYTGAAGTVGRKVDWIEGAGLVRVGGGYYAKFPVPVSRLGPLNYVQDGLITQFDALDNEGKGEFNPEAANWRNHLMDGGMPFTKETSWLGGRYLHKESGEVAVGPFPSFRRDLVTCECVVNILQSGGSYPRPFAMGEQFSVYFDQASLNAQVYISGQKPDTRPGLGTFRTGTVAILSDEKGYGGAVDGVVKAMTDAPVKLGITAVHQNWSFGYGGTMVANYAGLRLYNRRLSEEELAWNTLIDRLRYFSWAYADDGEQDPVAWADVAWQVPAGQTDAAPSATTNQYASISRATVAVAATDDVALAGLALDDGAKLAVAADAVVSAKVLFVNGEQIPHGIYTGADGTTGMAVDWVVGGGQVRVAGALDRGIPTICPVADADGWFTFGLPDGEQDQRHIVGEHPVWDDYVFPEGAKLRLRGYILLETVPDVFADYDTTQLQYALVNGARAYAADRPFDVPPGATIRYFPATWKPSATVANRYDLDKPNQTLAAKLSGDVNVAGTFSQLNDYSVNLTHAGCISGPGYLSLTSYGRQVRFTGAFALNGNVDVQQNGNGFWIDTLAVTSTLQTVSLSSCNNQYGVDEWYSASFAMFGKDGSDATADHPLDIVQLTGRGISMLDGNGRRWRTGGHVIVWGSNTVHVGSLYEGLHVIADRNDQECRNGFLGRTYTSKGIGRVEIDAFNSGTVYGSTNVEVTVGAMAAGTAFDFTYQSNAVNRLALDITGACAANTTVKATDLAMLPARLSGFAGTVTLTETEAKSYEMPIDFTAGLDGIYNPVGCNGSGTLAAAPATGTIDATFPTEDMEIEPGKYALARFSAGGDLLKNWTVTLNGERTSTARVGHHALQVRKDATGIWLGVDLPAMTIILR
ncbi:MAG: hypothetical protein PUE68_04070 [Kiritimatiellae bacterium]|nr:hypothetical protein [Kiritimatiellia bacterium]